MKINGYHLRYRLKEKFGISRMSRENVDALLVNLSDRHTTGWGEATDNPYYQSHIAELKLQLETMPSMPDIDDDLEHPIDFFRRHLDSISCHPFLVSALDRAYWDFYARRKKINVIDMMDWSWIDEEIPVSSFTIGLDEKEKMGQKIQSTSWPLYKIKIDGNQPLELLKYLRDMTDAPFMLDANGSLEIDQLEALIHSSANLKIQLVEQPVSQGLDHLLSNFHSQEEVLIAVDESIRSTEDLDRLRPYYHVANFKLMKNGGFTPCLGLLAEADALGYQKMMGCMTASSVSIAAICPFLPILDFVDMDGALLLEDDIASGISFESGRCQKPEGLGFGFTVQDELFNKSKVE
jgi:L-alanine-DL-glutamate epimerase-like enolase superfamily enzyme